MSLEKLETLAIVVGVVIVGYGVYKATKAAQEGISSGISAVGTGVTNAYNRTTSAVSGAIDNNLVLGPISRGIAILRGNSWGGMTPEQRAIYVDAQAQTVVGTNLDILGLPNPYATIDSSGNLMNLKGMDNLTPPVIDPMEQLNWLGGGA